MGILAALRIKATDSANRATAENHRRYTYEQQVGGAVDTADTAAPASADDPTQHLPRVSEPTGSR